MAIEKELGKTRRDKRTREEREGKKEERKERQPNGSSPRPSYVAHAII